MFLGPGGHGPWALGPMGPCALEPNGPLGPWARGPLGPWALGPMGPQKTAAYVKKQINGPSGARGSICLVKLL